MARVSSVRKPTNQKQNLVIEDFSGGINSLDSGLDFKSNQAIEHLNTEFSSGKFLTKRRGFEQVKFCENDQFLTSNEYEIEVVLVHNPLQDERKTIQGWKIRPFEFIVIQKTPIDKSQEWTRTRHLLVYDKANKTYTPALYKGYKLNEKTSFEYYDIDVPCVNGSIVPFSLSMPYLTILLEETYQEVIWEYSSSYNQLSKKDVNFITINEKIYIKAGSNEYNDDKNYYYLEQENGTTFDKFKQVVPRNTSVSQEGKVGWNLLYGFVYLVPNIHREVWKKAIDWGNKNQSLGVIANILGSDIPAAEPLSGKASDKVLYTIEGMRSNHPGIMPGSKIFNTACPITKEYFEIWTDFIQTPNRRIPLSGNMLKKGALSSYTYDRSKNKFYNSVRFGKREEGDVSNDENWARWMFHHEAYGLYPYFIGTYLYKNMGFASSIVGDSCIPRGNDDTNWVNNMPDEITTRSIDSGVLAIKWLAESDETYHYWFILYDDTNPILYYASIKKYEFEVKYDKELFNTNFVSLGEHQDANVKASELVEMNINNKLFYLENFVIFATKSRLFFSMPQMADWVPHLFSIQLDLNQQDDEIQNITYILGSIMIFTKYKIYKLSGKTPSILAGGEPFTSSTVSNDKGVIAADTLISLDNRAFHLATSGICTTFLSEQVADLYKPIEIDQAIKHKLDIDLELDQEAKAIAFKSQYIIYVPSLKKFFIRGYKKNKRNDERWAEWTTELVDNDKTFYNFAVNRNAKELYMLIGGKMYVLSNDQFYDGAPNATGDEKHLYECKWISGLLDAYKPEADKKFSRLQINCFIPQKKGAKVYIKSYIGSKQGFRVSEPNEFELQANDVNIETAQDIIKPDIEFNAGAWFGKEGEYGVSKIGHDQVPVKAMEFPNKLKGRYLTLEVSTKDDVPFILTFVAVRFKYKKSKYSTRS